MKDLYSLSTYQFALPQELIAQYPCDPRDSSRLMIIDRAKEEMFEMNFFELGDFLKRGDNLIFNNTKVIPARLIGRRAGGGEAEIFLIKRIAKGYWRVLAKPGKKLKPGSKVFFDERFHCTITDALSDGQKVACFEGKGSFEDFLSCCGRIPLPHYIRRGVEEESDKKAYQTIFAEHAGALAAPTAGLHFTDSLLNRLNRKGVKHASLTLHVGLGTFRPVQTEDIRSHEMHAEELIISEEAASFLNARTGNARTVVVGTTCCRALESAANEDGVIIPGTYETEIFIYPGYRFKFVSALLTNFHLPGSTLLMLVSAFGGYDLIMEAYRKAVKERFRFFSYGDAMLII